MVKTFCWLRFGWFRHPSWAVGSFSSGKPAAGTRSMGGFDYPDWVILYHVTRAWIALVTWCSRIGILTKTFYGPSSFLQEKAPCKKKRDRESWSIATQALLVTPSRCPFCRLETAGSLTLTVNLTFLCILLILLLRGYSARALTLGAVHVLLWPRTES